MRLISYDEKQNVAWIQKDFLGSFAEPIIAADQPEKSMGVQKHLHPM
jgi:hypothetical protein